jgi:6-phosphogluconolactonase (cycloisomerase 2 family)
MTTKTSLRIFELASDGSLTEAAVSPFELGEQPLYVRASDDGSRLFVVTWQAHLDVLAIDGAGALAMVGQQPVGGSPQMVSVHPNGHWIYVPAYGSAEIDGFDLAAGGQLTALPGSPYVLSPDAFDWLEVHPNGRWAYAVDDGPELVQALAIDQSTGALSNLGVSTWFTADSDPHAAWIDATGRYGYIANDLSSGVPAFTIDASGAMSTTPGSKFGYAANTCIYAAMNRARTRFYLGDDGSGLNALVAYRIDAATGALTAIPGSPYPTDNVMWFVGATPVSDDVYTTTTHTRPAIRHFVVDDTQVAEREDYDFPGLDAASVLAIAHPP